MSVLSGLLSALGETARDVLPIAAVLVGFQVLVLRRSIPHPGRILGGFVFVVIGLSLFLQGLEQALFPIGQLMALQLTDPEFLLQTASGALGAVRWQDYYWVYAFAFCIGFATTIAEPALIAVAMKAEDVSAGAIGSIGLRVAVALGVAVGIALGAWRIVTGLPLEYFIMAGYVVVIIQTIFAPRLIIALAYDSGGVTTSTVTVPLVAALGLGLAGNVPGRSPLIDGFGLIAFASLFPIMSVLAYAQIVEWRSRRKRRDEESPP
ncbi:MAG: DUF1538 domain-containing protein [Gammaproteobacteria bacterium]|jgi:hypothetical protein|nr:DUF1538 domain-containing protein [Gammaproteobacteria bacterium]